MKKLNKDTRFIFSLSMITLVFFICLLIILSSLTQKSKTTSSLDQTNNQDNIILDETEMFSRAIKKKTLLKPTKDQTIKSTFKLSEKNIFL
jgi:maltose-binding protein MalE